MTKITEEMFWELEAEDFAEMIGFTKKEARSIDPCLLYNIKQLYNIACFECNRF